MCYEDNGEHEQYPAGQGREASPNARTANTEGEDY